MTTVATHPSEIQFTCPSWCNRTREQHLQDLGDHGGRLMHWSADATGKDWAVALSSCTYPDGTQADDDGVQIEVTSGPDIVMPLHEVRALMRAIEAALETAERA